MEEDLDSKSDETLNKGVADVTQGNATDSANNSNTDSNINAVALGNANDSANNSNTDSNINAVTLGNANDSANNSNTDSNVNAVTLGNANDSANNSNTDSNINAVTLGNANDSANNSNIDSNIIAVTLGNANDSANNSNTDSNVNAVTLGNANDSANNSNTDSNVNAVVPLDQSQSDTATDKSPNVLGAAAAAPLPPTAAPAAVEAAYLSNSDGEADDIDDGQQSYDDDYGSDDFDVAGGMDMDSDLFQQVPVQSSTYNDQDNSQSTNEPSAMDTNQQDQATDQSPDPGLNQQGSNFITVAVQDSAGDASQQQQQPNTNDSIVVPQNNSGVPPPTATAAPPLLPIAAAAAPPPVATAPPAAAPTAGTSNLAVTVPKHKGKKVKSASTSSSQAQMEGTTAQKPQNRIRAHEVRDTMALATVWYGQPDLREGRVLRKRAVPFDSSLEQKKKRTKPTPKIPHTKNDANNGDGANQGTQNDDGAASSSNMMG